MMSVISFKIIPRMNVFGGTWGGSLTVAGVRVEIRETMS